MDKNRNLRILLVEDDEDDYVLVKDLLSRAPFANCSLDWAQTFEAGLDAICRIRYDAYLLDYMLGVHTGLEFLSAASKRGCEAPVILLTGIGGRDIDIEAMQAGVSDYLSKQDINPEVLERSIRYAIERKKAEKELRRYKDHLEELVQQRTSQLQESNLKLRTEIEEREKAEQALRQSEEKYRALVMGSQDIIFTISLEGIISSVNPAFEKITGWREEDWVGRSLLPLVHPDDRELLQLRVEGIKRDKTLSSAEIRILTKSGELRLLEFKTNLQHKDGIPIGLLGTARDITARKHAEEQVLEQNRFLNTVLESLSHPFYVLDANDYTILMANAAASPNLLPPKTKCFALLHGRDAPCSGKEHFCPLDMIKKTKKPLICEHVHDESGSPHYFEIHGYPIFDEKGEVSKIIEYALDVTDRREFEEALRKAHNELEVRVQKRTAELARSNEALRAEIVERKRVAEALRLDEIRLEALLRLSQMSWASEDEIGSYVLDQQVKLTRSKIGSLGFLDEDEKTLMLHAWSSEVLPECRVLQKPLHYPIDQGGIWADAVRERRPIIVNDYSLPEPRKRGIPSGHVPLERFMSIPVFDGERIIAVAIVANKEEEYDQSDVRQLTLLMDGMWKLMQRRRSEKALRDAESLAGIGKALSGVAHDMKTPLIAIGGFTKLVQSHMESANPDREKMGIVLKETERLEKMVKDMLDFARPLKLEKTEEDLGRIILESLKITRKLAEDHGVELQSESSGLATVTIDGARIKQVLINLVTNAIQASPRNETIYVGCRRRGASILISVRDSGPGIAPEIRKDIFTPFFTTKKEGTGLGLPIVRKIVEAHKGRVEATDNPDKGVTFHVVLPVE